MPHPYRPDRPAGKAGNLVTILASVQRKSFVLTAGRDLRQRMVSPTEYCRAGGAKPAAGNCRELQIRAAPVLERRVVLVSIIRFFLTNICNYRDVILTLARRQLASRYIGTLGGPIWAVAQPVATVGVFWVVFSLGFRSRGPGNMPFLLYFMPGYVAWLLFSEIVTTSTSVVVGNAFLVKKTLFPVEVLPLVNAASATVTHGVMLAATIAFVLLSGRDLPATLPAVLYFYGATVILAVGIAWIVSSLNVFYRDVEQVIQVLINLWFWATPIAWPSTILPKGLAWLFKINPMYFVVEGYRTSLVGIPSASFGFAATWHFWAIATILLLLGTYVFGRLKPEFPEML